MADQECLFPQTEIQGVHNAHGLKEGWTWLARFLNALPANIFTAVALNAFLQVSCCRYFHEFLYIIFEDLASQIHFDVPQMAGFALFNKYKSQFRKILNVISDNFLNAMEARDGSKLNLVIKGIQSYIEDKKFLEEPEGRTLQASLLSRIMVPDSDYQEYYGGYQY